MAGERLPRSIACAVGTAWFLLCGTSHADLDPAKAERLFEEGTTELAAGHVEAASRLLALSYVLDPQPGSLVDLSLAYEQLGRTASAWLLFQETAREATAKGQITRAALAQVRADGLARRLSRLTVTVAPQPEAGAVAVMLDHVPLAQDRWGSALPVDPGEHEVEATSGGARQWSQRFVVTVALDTSVAVPEAEPQPKAKPREVADPEPTADRDPSLARPIAWTLTGTGLAALGVGVAFGVAGFVNKGASTRDGNCVPHGADIYCNPIGASALNQAQHDALFADIAYGVGGALLLTGGLLFAWDHWASNANRTGRVRVNPLVGRGSWALALDGVW